MQFVLNHKVRWRQAVHGQWASCGFITRTIEAFRITSADTTEETADFTGPRHRGELIDGGDDEAGQPPIDRFVHRQNRKVDPLIREVTWNVLFSVTVLIQAPDS